MLNTSKLSFMPGYRKTKKSSKSCRECRHSEIYPEMYDETLPTNRFSEIKIQLNIETMSRAHSLLHDNESI